MGKWQDGDIFVNKFILASTGNHYDLDGLGSLCATIEGKAVIWNFLKLKTEISTFKSIIFSQSKKRDSHMHNDMFLQELGIANTWGKNHKKFKFRNVIHPQKVWNPLLKVCDFFKNLQAVISFSTVISMDTGFIHFTIVTFIFTFCPPPHILIATTELIQNSSKTLSVSVHSHPSTWCSFYSL